jgi:hypothetical protein
MSIECYLIQLDYYECFCIPKNNLDKVFTPMLCHTIETFEDLKPFLYKLDPEILTLPLLTMAKQGTYGVVKCDADPYPLIPKNMDVLEAWIFPDSDEDDEREEEIIDSL